MKTARDELDDLMDDLQVIYTMRAGQTVTQEEVNALLRLDEHWREDSERAADVYRRGFQDGLRIGGGASGQELQNRLDEKASELSTTRALHRFRLGDLHKLLVEARDLLMERIHGNPARSAAHNARLVIEAAIARADPAAPAQEDVGSANPRGSHEL